MSATCLIRHRSGNVRLGAQKQSALSAAVVLLCSIVATPAIADVPAATYKLERDSVFSFSGIMLGGFTTFKGNRSDPVARPNKPGFGVLAELEIRGPKRTWNSRCTFNYGTMLDFSAACDFVPVGGGKAVTFVVGKDLRGSLIGVSELDVSWDHINLKAISLAFSRGSGGLIGEWGWSGLTIKPMELKTKASTDDELEMMVIAVLSMQLIDGAVFEPNLIAPTPSNSGNDKLSYPVVAGGPREDRGQFANLATIEGRGQIAEAAILRRHLEDSRRLDVRPGMAHHERFPNAAKLIMGLLGTAVVGPGLEGGKLGGVGGGLEVIGGINSGRWSFLVGLGMATGEIDNRAFKAATGANIANIGFHFNIRAQYAIPIAGGLEGVGGFGIGARFRSIDARWAESVDDLDGAMQVGVAFAPLLGAQYLFSKPTPAGPYFRLVTHVSPELRIWSNPSVSAPVGREAESMILSDGLSGPDLAVRVSLGLRMDL
jgi:hypothetical protein